MEGQDSVEKLLYVAIASKLVSEYLDRPERGRDISSEPQRIKEIFRESLKVARVGEAVFFGQ